MPQETQAFLRTVTDQVRPLERAFFLAEWQAAVSANPTAMAGMKRAQAAYIRFWSDPERLAAARRLKEREGGGDPLIVRQLDLISLTAARNQQDPDTIERVTELESRVRQRYYNYRPRVEGRELSDNEIDEILKTSRDSAQVERVWKASKEVGRQVAGEVRELARLRNAAARSQGYRDHFQLSLALEEIDEAELLRLFADLEELSREPFARLKAEIDRGLAARFAVGERELRPWHYGDRFFQEGPQLEKVDLDSLLAGARLETIAVLTYDGVGMDVRGILSRSDLYPRPGKNQHAFCIHVDRRGDIRTLNNLQPTHRWAQTLLHELGHGVYEHYLDPALPWLLRVPAHTFTTEAVAILMGSLSYDPQWYARVLGVPDGTAGQLAASALREERARKLIFTRWCLTMTHFERTLYGDPEADLDAIWWDLAGRFQLLRRPDGRRTPDWAGKIHVALVPVYYHNYQLGQLMASQLRRRLIEDAGGIVGVPAAGRWLIERIFSPGARLDWRGLIRRATGEGLTHRYFIEALEGRPASEQ